MLFQSTNKKSPKVDFREATIKGQAPDKGLYFPEKLPHFERELLGNFKTWSNQAIALHMIRPYVGHSIPPVTLERIVSETINFEFPLVQVDEDIHCLELFHGPTLAFKDVGARFMSRCLGYFVRDIRKRVTVLVATSGDTGGAVANGFQDVEGVNVVILYPSGKVSPVQELQLTTNGNNIHALEIKGTFDDCQLMVKQAFADQELNKQLFLTSANSINVARWLPQQFYYAFALKKWKENSPPVVAVPSGNFGNLCAGLLAFRSGLPIKHFIAACNTNDVVPHYFKTGRFEPKPAIATLSNAMDVGHPSNFVRMLELFNHDFANLNNLITSYSISDEITRQVIKQVYTHKQYLMDPHGAVGYISLKEYLMEHEGQNGFFLGTAHPIKFHDALEPIVGKIPLPAEVKELQSKEKKSIKMNPKFSELTEFLLATQ
jgi:threonine synthase